MKPWWWAILALALAGCASSSVVVKIASPPTPVAGGQRPAQVTVNDLRAPGVAAGTREAAFGVPMGNILFDPPEKQLVKEALESTLTQRQGGQAGEPYVCDIVEFRVGTNTTPLYWDVVASIRLTLKRNGREQALYGTHTERTYVWPGEAVIRKAVEESLQKAVQGADPTLGART